MSNKNIKHRIRRLVNMSDDLDLEGATNSIRNGIRFRGANAFILACAIIIASVGLNVNSIPVIIGAMLISPVMAPILGFGFGLAIQDYQLVHDSLKNLLVMVTISIGASFIYFLLTPLHLENPTELLARTNPTLYDVLIALFGGFAGILEQSRKSKGTVISGVAIATALMPPLCTVGYGLSQFNPHYIFGALYLFTINSIFIALATFLVTKYLKYPVVSTSDTRRRLSSRKVALLLLIVIIPSVFSAVRIVRESNFNRHVQNLVTEQKNIGRSYIYDYKTHFSSRHSSVEFFLAGPVPTEQEMENFYVKAEQMGVLRNQMVFNDNNAVASLSMAETDIVKDVFKTNEERIAVLSDSVSKLSDSLGSYRSQNLLDDAVAHEILVQYPNVRRVTLGNALTLSSGEGNQTATQYNILLETTTLISDADIAKLKAWVQLRMGKESVSVTQSVLK